MRSAIVSFVVVMSLSVCAYGQDQQAGLVLHYSFDHVTNRSVADQSGRGNDGKLMGGARRVTGRFGPALELNGVDGYVDCGAGTDLDIGKTGGTVMFWFRPQGARQGGLIGWTAGAEAVAVDEESEAEQRRDYNRPSHSAPKPAAAVRENQRLVVSLYSGMEDRVDGNHLREALGVYISDGTHFAAPSGSNQHKDYFPPQGKWLFYAVTFNGRAMDIYRDGVHVHSRFQTLIPDTKDVPMFIGRCFGMGGDSDYFRGQIDEVSVYNRPLSSVEIYDRYMQTVDARGKATDHFGGVGIEAQAYPKPGMIFADLDYRNLLVAAEDVGLSATLHDAGGTQVATGNIHMLPAWGRAEVRVDVAELPAGAYELRVSSASGEPRTATIEWPGRAEGWEHVKVLNNFCWDLLNQSQSPEAEYVFTNPRRGWVYIATEADGDVTLNLPEATPPTVRFADDGVKQEVMRWMEPGTYRITPSGNGSLKQWTVRSVPILAFHHYPHVGPGTGEDQAYLEQYVLAPYNMVLTHNYSGPGHESFRAKWSNELGRHIIDQIYTGYNTTLGQIFAQKKINTAAAARKEIWDFVAPSAGLNEPNFHGVSLDEFFAGNDRVLWTNSYYDEWTELMAQILEDPEYAGRFVIPWIGYNPYDFEESAAFVRMFVDHQSPVLEEWYIPERDTEAQAWLYFDECGAAIEPLWNQVIDGYTEASIKFPSLLRRESWNPAVDFKAHLQLQYEHFATRPEFFGIGGIGGYSSYICNNEEYLRWISQLTRHYGLEGHTDRLRDYDYAVDYVQNPDFIDGADGWTLQPAADGSMVVKHDATYGLLQERDPYRVGTDTPFLWTRRSAQKPNVFSQAMRGLTPGEMYMVRVWVGDYSEFKAGASKNEPRAMSLNVNGAEIWDGWYRSKDFQEGDPNSYTYGSYQAAPFGGGNLYYFKIHQLVFRAESTTAQLVITDWQNANEPGGPAGQELMFNFIEVRPFLPLE